jgi:hypothetical protein
MMQLNVQAVNRIIDFILQDTGCLHVINYG